MLSQRCVCELTTHPTYVGRVQSVRRALGFADVRRRDTSAPNARTPPYPEHVGLAILGVTKNGKRGDAGDNTGL